MPRALLQVSNAISRIPTNWAVESETAYVARKVNRRDQIVAFRNTRPQDAQITGERDGDSRDRAGLDDQEERPAIQESPQRRPRFSQVDILASGAEASWRPVRRTTVPRRW